MELLELFALKDLIRSVLTRTPKNPEVSLSGQTVLITGGSSGIGFETAKIFVKLGAKVILAVRSVPKGDLKKDQLLTGNKDAVIEVREVDLSSFQSIKDFARDLSREVERLDIAILNAGIYQTEFAKSGHGYEMQLQVNTLGTTLLGLLLLPILHRSGVVREKPARLLVVSSEGHALSVFSKTTEADTYRLESRNAEERYVPSQAHHLSKLFLVLLMREIADRVVSSNVIIGSVTPGYCDTNLYHDMNGAVSDFLKRIFCRPAASGAKLYVHAALSTEDVIFHKGYFKAARRVRTSKYTCSVNGIAFGRELWEETLELLNKEAPGGLEIDSLPLFSTS